MGCLHFIAKALTPDRVIDLGSAPSGMTADYIPSGRTATGSTDTGWYRWTSPFTGLLRLSSTQPIILMEQDRTTWVETVAATDDSIHQTFWRRVASGRTYYFKSLSYGGLLAGVAFSWGPERPSQSALNDAFANAFPLNTSEYATAFNFDRTRGGGASLEAGEPMHSSVPGLMRSTWWTYTATSSGPVSFSLGACHSTEETPPLIPVGLTVYRGGSISTLEAIASDGQVRMDRRLVCPVQLNAGQTVSIVVASGSELADYYLTASPGASPYDTWALAHRQLHPGLDLRREADPAHDGIPNYLKFLAGIEPQVNVSGTPWANFLGLSLQRQGDRWQLRAPYFPEQVYVQSSADGIDWNWNWNWSVNGNWNWNWVPDQSMVGATVLYDVPSPEVGRQFYRLKWLDPAVSIECDD